MDWRPGPRSSVCAVDVAAEVEGRASPGRRTCIVKAGWGGRKEANLPALRPGRLLTKRKCLGHAFRCVDSFLLLPPTYFLQKDDGSYR